MKRIKKFSDTSGSVAISKIDSFIEDIEHILIPLTDDGFVLKNDHAVGNPLNCEFEFSLAPCVDVYRGVFWSFSNTRDINKSINEIEIKSKFLRSISDHLPEIIDRIKEIIENNGTHAKYKISIRPNSLVIEILLTKIVL